MTEGRKREVRRLLAAVGLPVIRLVRLRVGPVVLGGLPPGGLRELDPDEVRALSEAAGQDADDGDAKGESGGESEGDL